MFIDIFYSVLALLIGIGVFLVGIVKFTNFMKQQKESVRKTFEKVGENRFVNFSLGAATTTVIQSSTATTVITVSLVNASILTLSQAIPVIFGANFGSALSNLLLSLSAFRIRYYFMLLVFVGAFTKLLTRRPRLNKLSDVFISFGIIFVGLSLMSGAFSDSDYLREGFEYLFETIQFPLLLILFAFLLTAIIQSSTAATAIFITMAANGVIGFSSIIYLVIGTSLGTTLTTILASIPANKNAKRTALVHLMFNVFGAVIFLSIVWPLQSTIIPFYERLIPNPVWQISVFTLIFNLFTALILLVFIKQINRLVHKIIKDDENQELTEEEQEQLRADCCGQSDKVTQVLPLDY
ncbi:MAG: Na/Pi symporter [Firmicutes bacterium]|nr:Na/Pi symporter [Bacillota bacterium]